LPGYSVFHFRDFSAGGEPTAAQALVAVDKVRAFFDAIKVYLPAIVSVQVSGEVPVIEDTTNTMTDIFTPAAPAVVTGTASGAAAYSAPVGAVVTWRTGVVRNGRVIRGRTFLVPLSSSAFQSDGTLGATPHSVILAAAAALRDQAGDGDLGVYARPTAPGATDGEWAAATGHSVPDMGAVLRSRRD
jgi:hypothetical protein